MSGDRSPLGDGASGVVAGFVNGLLRFDRSMVWSLDAVDGEAAGAPVVVVLRAYQYLLGGVRPPDDVRAALDRIDPAATRPWETAHLEVVRLLLNRAYRAASDRLFAVSAEFPADELALAAGHQVDFLTGETRTMLSRLTSSPLLVEGATPAYPYLLAMLAFAYGENDACADAAAAGERALELAPVDNPWAVHACAHVYFERRDYGAVDALLGATNSRWSAQRCLLRTHLTWHRALASMAVADRDGLTELVAEILGTVAGPSSAMQFCDAVSLLWRLRLAGIAGPDDFDALADRAVEIRAGSNSAFVDLHVLLAIVGADRHELARRIAAELGQDRAGSGDDMVRPRRTAIRVAQSFVEYCGANPESAVRGLISVLPEVVALGGSMIQRDLVLELLVNCAHGGGADLLIPSGVRVGTRPLVTCRIA
ncbi:MULTISPECIES: hypothetical protein [unclassified Nocardia]|uniref:hypothetical protein n=1 Tax=unclassified Nocardia TaxID=2637762 RepID=UPI0024A83EC0|nr:MULTISPECIES: hypothetical protein [unclassified Nocardia]